MNAPDSHDAVGINVHWTDEATKRLERAPLFLRARREIVVAVKPIRRR